MMSETKFVSYLRVSTAKQGRSGLGLDAQRHSVNGFLIGYQGSLVEEVVEVESGKRSSRPELARALSLCRIHRATLLVAKLDRLARNVAFISALMESGVSFQAIDLPNANNLTVHIMAAMAEYEAKAVSERTKVALAAAKARGTLLGIHSWRGGGKPWEVRTVALKGNQASSQVRALRAAKHAADLLPVVAVIQANGKISLRQLAAALNERKIPTARGGLWGAMQVKRLLVRR